MLKTEVAVKSNCLYLIAAIFFTQLVHGEKVNMEVEITHKVDKSEKNEAGNYDFYYEYDIYTFCESSLCFVARSYKDEPSEAHFLRKTLSGKIEEFTSEDLTLPLFYQAKEYLHKNGKTKIRYLGKNGYETL